MTAITIPADAPDEVVPPNGPADSAQEAHKEPSVPRRRYGGPIPEGETPQMLRAAVVRLAWPSILENALQSGLQIVTTAMIAQLGAIAIAGVGVSNQILIIGISSFFAVSTATTVMVAFNVGARNPKEASLAAKQSYFSRRGDLAGRYGGGVPVRAAVHRAPWRGTGRGRGGWIVSPSGITRHIIPRDDDD